MSIWLKHYSSSPKSWIHERHVYLDMHAIGHIFSSLRDRRLLNIIESNIIQILTRNCQVVAKLKRSGKRTFLTVVVSKTF